MMKWIKTHGVTVMNVINKVIGLATYVINQAYWGMRKSEYGYV